MMASTLVIEGGRDVVGEVYISGSKNAGLAIMAAALLASGQSTLEGVPRLSDIGNFGRILRQLGAQVTRIADTLQIETANVQCSDIPFELTRTMRASILILGPLLARFGNAKVSLPGGCAIGLRPIEQHIKGLERLGACVVISDRSIDARAPSGLHGAVLPLETPTVTGTMNLMLAACMARGVTHIQNAAREPEVADLAMCLISMGVTIHSAGTDHLTIHGRDSLLPYHYRVMKDRIEGGTFLILGAMAGNPLTVHGCIYENQSALIEKLRAIGAHIEVKECSMTVYKATRPAAIDVQTGPYPCFPTDLQPQLMALLSVALGRSLLTETVFELRFNQVIGLTSMGAHIGVDGETAIVNGVKGLSGSTVVATDLRAGASLVIAAIIAKGTTMIRCAEHTDRGYDRLDYKLVSIGVRIRRLRCLQSVPPVDA